MYSLLIINSKNVCSRSAQISEVDYCCFNAQLIYMVNNAVFTLANAVHKQFFTPHPTYTYYFSVLY